jgi:hypothetical protein
MELLGCEEAIRENISDRFQVNALVEDESSACVHGATGGLFGHQMAAGLEVIELGGTKPGRSLVVSECLVSHEYGFGGDWDGCTSLGIGDVNLGGYLAWPHLWSPVGMEIEVDLVVGALG